MTEFTPVAAAIGGGLIGLSAVLLLWLNGRVAGISGIVYGLFTRQSDERNWRLLFVAGLVLGGLIYQLVTNTPLATRSDFPLPLLIAAGLLVGIGTRLGSGCTSGHAVCGISHLSLRSIMATITFVIAGIATTTTVRLYIWRIHMNARVSLPLAGLLPGPGRYRHRQWTEGTVHISGSNDNWQSAGATVVTATPGPGGQLKRHCLILLATLFSPVAALADQSISDQYAESMLYAKPVEFIPNVWTATGATAPSTYANSGHNNNYTFIITDDGVVVVNSGSYLLAQALHEEIQKITDKLVVLVINENGQGHAMLGNGYWTDHDITILAHADAAATIAENGSGSLAQLKRVTKEKSDQSRIALPSKTFTDKYVIDAGGTRIEVLWLGHSHSSGDIVVWLPEQRLVISGDMAFHERMLPIFEETDTRLWLESWQRFEALDALYVIPGHGHPTNMAQVRRYTRDYLLFLRNAVQDLLDNGEDLQAAYKIDQSRYEHLDTFKELASRNAGRLFEQMEFE